MYFNDFQYYTLTFASGVITDKQDFDKVIIKANAYIKKITHNRIETVDDDIKCAICAVCDVLTEQKHSLNSVISENVGGHSITYGKTAKNEIEWDNAMYSAASLYLPAEYLYRGVTIC